MRTGRKSKVKTVTAEEYAARMDAVDRTPVAGEPSKPIVDAFLDYLADRVADKVAARLKAEDPRQIFYEEMQRVQAGLPPKHEIGFDFGSIFRGMIREMRGLKEKGFPRADYLDTVNGLKRATEGTGLTITFDERVLDKPAQD
jgi:hypothetical protein